MPIKTIQVPEISTIENACVSECGNYYLSVSHDNEGASLHYDCMMENCEDLWHYVLHGDTSNWKTLQDNFRGRPEQSLAKYTYVIAELSTGEHASWECLTNFLDKLDIPYEHYNGGYREDDYLFIGYHKDDVLERYGSDDIDTYKATLEAWYTTWRGLATGAYTCYWFNIQRIDGAIDDNCDSCGGFLVDDTLPYYEDIKDVMNRMRYHVPRGVVFDDESFKHAIDYAKYSND
jgi:hypothetical protein